MTSRGLSIFGWRLAPSIFRPHRSEYINLRPNENDSDTNNLNEPQIQPMNTDTEPSESRPLMRPLRTLQRTWHEARLITTEQLVGIFKCSLAYQLAALAVFIPLLGSILGHQNGKHLVATITIYFHPARTQGSMYKALICAAVAFLFAACLSLSSMWVTIVFHRKHDLIELGHAVVLIFFVVGGFGFIGWIKQRLSDPLVNVACSLASLASILVITKEGAVQTGELSFTKISQVLRMTLLGISISTAVSFLILPVSARKKFRGELSASTGTVRALLMRITESFLRGSDVSRTDELGELSASHDKVFGRMKSLLSETKLEHYVAGTEREHFLEKCLVGLVEDVTHNLGGLRHAVALQAELLAAMKYSPMAQLSTGNNGDNHDSETDGVEAERLGILRQSISQAQAPDHGTSASMDISSIHSPAEIFEILAYRLEGPILSLMSTLKEVFNMVSFGSAPEYTISIGDGAQDCIQQAANLYRDERNTIFPALRSELEALAATPMTKASLEEVFANFEYFSVSLLELSKQLKELLLVLEELQAETDDRPDGKSWEWLRALWQRDRGNSEHTSDTTSTPRFYGDRINTRSSLHTSAIIDESWTRHQRSNQDNAVRPFDFLRKDEMKFALKVGIGAAIYALPSFISVTRPIYLYWRGEWGLISYMLVCSMTIGASTTTGIARFLGTCLGGLCSIIAWYMAGTDAFKLAMVGFIMTLGPLYLIIVKDKAPLGRFILLTYNLSVLYAFSVTHDPAHEDEHHDITEIVLHRVAAVISGNIWGIIVTRGIWPIRAQAKLNDTLESLWLQLVHIWESEPLNKLSSRAADSPVFLLSPRDKVEIERLLSQLDRTQAYARSESEFRAHSLDSAYSNVIRRTREIVDNFHALDLVLFNTSSVSEGQLSLLRYTAASRQELSQRIRNLLAAMASSVKLEETMFNDLQTKATESRYRLLEQISRYRQEDVSRDTNEEDYALIYSYVLVSRQLSKEIVQIMAELGHIFPDSSEELVGAFRV